MHRHDKDVWLLYVDNRQADAVQSRNEHFVKFVSEGRGEQREPTFLIIILRARVVFNTLVSGLITAPTDDKKPAMRHRDVPPLRTHRIQRHTLIPAVSPVLSTWLRSSDSQAQVLVQVLNLDHVI